MSRTHQQFIKEEQAANQLLRELNGVNAQGLSSSSLGDRLRTIRKQQGLSIRDVATAAGVSKTSVVRLEQGGRCESTTVIKVCSTLGVHLATLAADPGKQVVTARTHHHTDSRWYDLTGFSDGPLGGENRPLTKAELRCFAADGISVPLLILKSRLPEGKLLSTVLELFATSETRRHPGEEFAYVLSGNAVICVANTEYLLHEGESIVFRSAEPHSYAPAPGTRSNRLPVRVLSVRLDAKLETRNKKPATVTKRKT